MGAGVVKKAAGGGRRRRHRGSSAAMSEINVTPFVDVMLVLMIIFMVAAPMLTVGVPIKLPETSANAMPNEEEPLTITLTKDGLLMIQTTEYSQADLIPKLKAIVAARSNNKVFLRADGALPYEAVAQVTHIAPADPDGTIIGSKVVAPGVIEYDCRKLGLCAGITGAHYVTTTEVYPDSPRATAQQCNDAQAAAVRAALEFALGRG